MGLMKIKVGLEKNVKNQKKHRPKTNEPIECSVCGATFTERQSLSKHTEVKHGDVINFPCDECGQLFPRKSKNCSQHFSRTCSLCEKVFFLAEVF